ncbi:MAG: hypothetical protein K2J70_04415, partial [Muribaculaceae bacterium]|nr:hypothetical protein [Muribaculaceae bacterium]
IHILENPATARCVRNFLIGGSAISPLIREKIVDSGISAFESYGMTETASHIALRKITEHEDPFEVLPGIEIFHHSGNLLGIKLELAMIVKTNDIAEIDGHGRFRIIGRADNAIITGGKKVFPEEIEKKLSEILHCPFYISSLPDPKWGQRVVLVSLLSAPPDSLIIRLCRAALLPHEIPKEIYRVESLHYTSNGKIKRIMPTDF